METVGRGHQPTVDLADGIELVVPIVECLEVKQFALGNADVGHRLPFSGTVFAELRGANLVALAIFLHKPIERLSDGVGALVCDVHVGPHLIGIVVPDNSVALHLVDIDLDVVGFAVAAASHYGHACIGIGAEVECRVG